MAKKQYENFMVFGARIYGMKNLWQPSTDFKGQQTKPNYLAGFLVPKTQPHWSTEPVLQNLWQGMQKIHAATMAGLDYNAVGWPVRDGDVPPDPQTPPAEWARGHWMFSGNSGDVIKVEISQGQNVVPLQARGNIVKPGDYVIVGGATAINSQNPRAIKLYINNVVFTSPGEEIAVGNSVSGAELMQSAMAQGYRPTGFAPSPAMGGGGFAGAPNGGGFTQPAPGAHAHGGGFGNPATNTAPGQNGQAFGGSATSHFNPPAGGAFPAAPGGFPGR